MEFAQKIEEIMVERPVSFDVVMESLFAVDYKMSTERDKLDNAAAQAAISLTEAKDNKMSSSLVSNIEDTTPSDSGVQMLDSESSELMVESITSQTGFDFEDLKPLIDFQMRSANDSTQSPTEVLPPSHSKLITQAIEGDFDTNSNVMEASNVPDVMNTSNCSTFDTENIVYRRKFRKSPSKAKAPKKRVSFHEDILKNTRTDNIHIEHGFVTYKNGRKTAMASIAGRYSWCSEGDANELCSKNRNDDQDSQIVYRNACSDVLDYGNLDVYENTDRNNAKYDNSGVFEYTTKKDDKKPIYNKCSCSSSSNSSSDSEEVDKNSNNRQNYGQAKSNSCDCIGINNANNNFIGDNCYFSEPNINNLNDKPKKSVWSKEKKPKSSCLKKTKWHIPIIPEQDLNNKMKKFNVHDMNHLIDNSKMIFGSLKSIFTSPLPERGVPEGSEDLQSVYECLPEVGNTNQNIKSPSPIKQRPFLSKSLDGSKKKNPKVNFVHNVDEQLRRKNDSDIFAPTRQNSSENEEKQTKEEEILPKENEEAKVVTTSVDMQNDLNQFRNKFIINCESTVFEHTGVSYSYDNPFNDQSANIDLNISKEYLTPVAQPEPVKEAFMSVPMKQTFANLFRTLKETATSPTGITTKEINSFSMLDNCEKNNLTKANMKKTVRTNESSSSAANQHTSSPLCPSFDVRNRFDVKHNRHLQSPIKRRQTKTTTTTTIASRYDYISGNNRVSPDLFNYYNNTGGSGRDSKSTILSEEFDEILTITTDTDKNDNDIVIVDYPELSENGEMEYASTINAIQMQQHLMRPQNKTSLINRFLRNVTQKKIIETTIRKNSFFANKVKSEQKLFTGNLYLRGVKPKNNDLIEDLNAEIAMEIEMSGTAGNSPRRELIDAQSGFPDDISQFELGIGEISIDIFNGNYMHILRCEKEQLMKVFKLYTGYSREGFMTPVLVFLTDQTLYVVDLVRNRLCSKFVLPFCDLDVILMGPYGNTVLLSNSVRDMQQVLLAGGPYPADRLVANLELCARRGGSILPAVGQLTLDHLQPLQDFVRNHSTVDKYDSWVYYAVVNIPAGTLGSEKEPLGPHVKGFLMHRRIKEFAINSKQNWDPGYFLLKAGVLYMFSDSSQKIPSWAMALAECRGARRALKTGRPHCFEILIRNQLLQLAAPDEYVASEWLQALLQSASGLFEMQDKHKTLGCTLIMTKQHLITLREDFTSPLRQLNKSPTKNASLNNANKSSPLKDIFDVHGTESSSIISSATSTPTKKANRSNSSMSSTPTKFSQLSRSTVNTTVDSFHNFLDKEKNYTSISSVYGKQSGIEILTCADIKDMIGIKIPSHNETWWCVLEFSCQEVRESSDDLVLFFASSSEMQRFLRILERLWKEKNKDLFPITLLDENDSISVHCSNLYTDINRSWEPLISAALGYPL